MDVMKNEIAYLFIIIALPREAIFKLAPPLNLPTPTPKPTTTSKTSPEFTTQTTPTRLCLASNGVMDGPTYFIQEDSEAEYTCSWRTNGLCDQQIVWNKNDTVISGRIVTDQHEDTDGTISSTLTLKTVTTGDNGIITCSFGNQTQTRSLLVQEKPRLKIDPQSQTLSVEEGGSIEIRCQVINSARIGCLKNIQWCRSGILLSSLNSCDPKKGQETSILSLHNIGNDAAGTYVCGVPKNDSKCRFAVSLSKVITTHRKEAKPCVSEEFDKLQWETTPAGRSQTQNCTDGYDGVAVRHCGFNSQWDPPNLLKCVKTVINDQIKKLDNLGDDEGNKSSVISNVLESLFKTTSSGSESKKLSSGDLDKTTSALDQILYIASNTTSGVVNETSFVGVLDNLLSLDNKETWSNVHKESNKSASKILHTVEALGVVIAKSLSSNESRTVIKSNIEIQVTRSSKSINFRTEHFKSGRQLEINLNAPGDKTYTSALYKTISSLLPNNKPTGRYTLTSEVLALDIQTQGNWVNETNPVSLNFDTDTFAKENNLTGSYNITCVYWNFTLNDWTDDGCYFHDGACQCSHLTNFAVLMSPAGQLNEADAARLRIISLIGCSLSVIATVVTMLVYLRLWRYVASYRSKLLLNLCAALTVAYMLFLVGIDKTENTDVCTALTVLMHYFFLSAFCLMLAEGIDILIAVVAVFSTKSRLKWLLLLGWGAPVVVVSVTIGISYENEYHSDLYCWLTVTNGVIYSFAGPVVGIIAINSFILVYIIRAFYSTRRTMSKSRKQKIVAGVRSVGVLLPTLGITWLFGILSINDDLVAFQYLFAVTNSLQGFLIFLLHVVFNDKVRKGVREKVKRYKINKQDAEFSAPKKTQKSINTLSTSDEKSESKTNSRKDQK